MSSEEWDETVVSLAYEIKQDLIILCKEWGLQLCESFGPLLGMGDYGHLVIQHASTMMRSFRSMKEFSNQGFESSHKADCGLYQQATNNDMMSKDCSGLL
ncbi:Hypothetical predicted protein [Paramuricea clavata]|uniref:Uncharacterized protein n=1 Tax=Paramuricea clavata TaxID=317549 RepID=A0A7D9DBM1_PARCT|nr:Hypothetical predicted protein [Paramuricea clavata]